MSKTYLVSIETHKESRKYVARVRVLDATPRAPIISKEYVHEGFREGVAVTRAIESAITGMEYLEDRNTYDEMIRILSEHCGETGVSEGAVETLQRIIGERDSYQRIAEGG